MPEDRSFTGRRRTRNTRRAVRFADLSSRAIITVVGIGTIVAVATVCLFLVAVVVPLFLPSEAEPAAAHEGDWNAAAPLHLGVDEYLTIGHVYLDDGSLVSFRVDDGRRLERQTPFGDRTPTAWSFGSMAGAVVAGFDDGTIAVAAVDYETEFLDDRDVPDDFFERAVGEPIPFRDGIAQRTPEDQFRFQRLVVRALGSPRKIAEEPIVALHHATDDASFTVCAIAGGRLLHVEAEIGEDMMTGEPRLMWGAPTPLPYARRDGRDAPFVRVAGLGDVAYTAWTDGHASRVRMSSPAEALVAEEVDLVPEAGRTLTALEFLLGGTTLMAGRSDGSVEGWFTVPVDADDPRPTGDGFRLVNAKAFDAPDGGPAVASLAPTTRRRMFAAGYADGSMRVFHMTSQKRLVEEPGPADASAIVAVALSPKEDAILTATTGGVQRWAFDPGYPEATVATLFGPVWYEGYAGTEFMWQSSSASDDFEPKLSLVPLIFGSIKATFYSMLFGAPLALLAAIYTSEFLDPKWKAWIKPLIEMMASLPSVVLGFLAAIVFAPVIEKYVPAALAAFFTLPLAFLVGALLWQLLPRRLAIRLSRHRLTFIGCVLPIGIVAAITVGPVMERWLFGRDLAAWLNGRTVEPFVGNPLGGWVLLLLPIGAVAVALAITRWISPRLRRATRTLDARRTAFVSLGTFLAGAAATLALVVAAGSVLGAVGLDIRKPMPLVGSFVSTYDQRNALVVGFIMGFAIIPIIYTIADDALSTVPEHLRSASLGAGATPWQTAVRIIIPTAMSGLFSALMIGLGRAVGETMIVLMAAGNTPVMNINMFEGFRTLSANIAVELPEAPVGETHYRTLFLAALTLFAMTFVVNTVAEAVRLRFRRRAYQL